MNIPATITTIGEFVLWCEANPYQPTQDDLARYERVRTAIDYEQQFFNETLGVFVFPNQDGEFVAIGQKVVVVQSPTDCEQLWFGVGNVGTVINISYGDNYPNLEYVVYMGINEFTGKPQLETHEAINLKIIKQ